MMQGLDFPFIGGISGTTRDYNNMLKAVFGDLSPDEFWHFQFLNASFMIQHGYHSMFETLYPASFYEERRGRKMRKVWEIRKRTANAKKPLRIYRSIYEKTHGRKMPKVWTARKKAAHEKAPLHIYRSMLRTALPAQGEELWKAVRASMTEGPEARRLNPSNGPVA